MTDAGEVAADVGLEYVVHLLGHDLQAQRLQSVVRVAPRSKAVTAVEEIRFKHGLDNARYRSLQQPIRDRGERLPLAAINRANHACIRLNPYGVQTMKQSYASAGKAPRRRDHSLSGIAAIAECGLRPPRIVIGYPAHQVRSGAEPCLSLLVLECRSRRRP